jgi:nitronate monooxygenase
MAIQNRLTQMLGIEPPVLLAPMDVVSGGRLAAAVSQAGGLGLLGGGYGHSDWIDREWERAGNARIGCGFITWSLAERPRILDLALANRPVAVMLSFGDPRPFAPAIRDAGARLICQAQTLSQAREAMEAGADVIVAQGTEAGGHGMTEPLLTLLPQIVDAYPAAVVVAAGGIADGRGMAAGMILGAQGVLMGTRFYASQEADGHSRAKQRIVEADGGQTVRSIVFDLSRGIRWPATYTGCPALPSTKGAAVQAFHTTPHAASGEEAPASDRSADTSDVTGTIEVLRLPVTPVRSLICFASGVHAILLGSCLAACAPTRSEVPSGPGSLFNRRPDLPVCLHVDVSGISQVPR